MNKKKIIIITTNLTEIGGLERVSANLANLFKKYLNYDITVINLGEKIGKEKYMLNSKIKIKYINLPNRSSKSYFYMIENMIIKFIKLKRFIHDNIEEDGESIIIGMGTGISYMLPFLFKNKYIKLIGTQHHPVNHKFFSDKIRKFIIKKLDFYVVLNNSSKEYLERYLNIKNVKVIPNPVILDSRKKSELTNKVVLSVGRLTYEKGFDMLIDSWNIISKKNQGWKLLIVGEGPEKQKLEKKINDFGLNDSIFIKNFTTNIESYYLESALYVLPSRFEGFGLVIVEAQSLGLPVVAFDCPIGPKNIINNDIDGYLVKANDIEELAKKINYLMENDNVRKRLSDKAIINSERFSVDRVIEKWKEILKVQN